jgi:uncharacterized membrane protein
MEVLIIILIVIICAMLFFSGQKARKAAQKRPKRRAGSVKFAESVKVREFAGDNITAEFVGKLNDATI